MAKRSVKEQLIERIDAKAADRSLPQHARQAWAHMAAELRSRGSGPLPFVYRELARGWGIT